MNWNDLLLRLRALVLRNRLDRELADELKSHIELQAQKNLAAGMSAAEAQRQARIQFGGAARITEECRDVRGVTLITSMFADIRYALRGFRRTPTFVLTVVATIALGLGLNTALFTIFNAYYFRSVPVHEPHSLYEFFWTDRAGDGHQSTWPEYQEFLRENPAFSEALAYQRTEVLLDDRHLFGHLVSGEYFRMLGVGAALGRTLLPDDAAAPGREPVIVLSYFAWENQFGSAPDIIGKKILLRGYPFEVVGVARSGFAGLGGRPIDFWAPVTMAGRFDQGPDLFGPEHPRSLSIVGRLKTGFSVRQAQAAVTLWAQQFTADSPDAEKAAWSSLMSRATAKPFNYKTALAFSPLLVAFALVLLIACANVANMMLARGMSRQQEIGIRLSLGASRGRLIRQLVTESVLLALPAAAIGFAVSQATIGLCLRVMFATLPPQAVDFVRVAPLSPDVRVFGATLGAALISALCFGVAPAMQATRANILPALRGNFACGIRPLRLQNSLVVGQITVCVLLLITAGILLRGVNQVQSLLDTSGLSARDVLEIVVQEKSRARVLGRLSSEPTVQILAAAGNAPIARKPTVLVMPDEGGATVNAAANNVSPEYFTVFEIPIVRGRNFTTEEAHSGSPVAIISQATAEQLWPNQEAVGHSLRLASDRGAEGSLGRYRVVSVIGIARDEISRWIANGEDKTLVYFPSNPQTAGNELLVRVNGDVETARRTLAADLTAIDPQAVGEIRKIQIQEWVAEDIYSFRVAFWVSSSVGVLALLLTLSGIYGVVAYVVSQRTKEIGIRMALGATARSVAGLVLKQSMRLGLIGTALGIVLALGASRILASGLVMINTFDGLAYISGVLLVLAACAAAAYFPSRRAARIDPITTLRYD
jgi:predicted permease